MKKLASSGINLLLEDRDAEYNKDLKLKDFEMEKKAYESISALCSVCTFASSKWNKHDDATQEKGIFKFKKELHDPRLLSHKVTEDLISSEVITDRMIEKEVLSKLPTDEDEWNLFFFQKDKCGFIDCNDNSEALSTNQPPDHITHLNLALALEEKYTEISIDDMVQSSNHLVIDTVKRILNVVRPLFAC